MKALEKAARAAYEKWIEDVRDLEPSWDELPQSHRDRLIACQRAVISSIEVDDAKAMTALDTYWDVDTESGLPSMRAALKAFLHSILVDGEGR